ncbi:sarcosine oxidase subunit alpha family protein [Tranquillimonas rosea]|uniref:sarcosine oxidase subunit alpha family protein n=1 Tax=Tranquillimonas rosea TaxID=641238 RepID=UPI003BAD2F4A
MSRRLSQGGRLIDRSRTLHFTVDGRRYGGFAGDTLASALLASNRTLMGRSFKYHRPRGVVSSGAEEPNALFGLGTGDRFEPNQRATMTELYPDLTALSQNRWPNLEQDLGGLISRAARVLPAGFYYKTFLRPRVFWKHVYEPVIRALAGLGHAPAEKDADRYEHFNVTVDVLIVGGGVAGLQAARRAGAAGLRVLLVEQTAQWGGRAPVDGAVIEGKPADAWITGVLSELQSMPNVHMRPRTMGAGVYDHGYALVYERVTDHVSGAQGPRHRLWRVRAGRILTTTGALERPLSFAGNDLPGVMLAGAVRDYVVNHAVTPGERVLVVTNNDDAYRTALALSEAGVTVPAIVDARPGGGGALAEAARSAGLRVLTGTAIAGLSGKRHVTGAALCLQDGTGEVTEQIACDTVAMSGGWSPVVHLWSHCGGKLTWDVDEVMFRPDPNRPPTGADGRGFVEAAGAANGYLATADILGDADRAARAVTEALGRSLDDAPAPQAEREETAPIRAVWTMPEKAPVKLREKMWLDYQNDVKVSDVALAAQEGFESVEHAKRYTTLGMATDQGKLSNINGLAILADTLGAEIPAVGTTTFRPPYTPISIGSVAGEARGDLFQPIRRTPLHHLHEAAGAVFEPVGHWRRPYAFPRDGETVAQAVEREILTVRHKVGLLDASTLGKIIVKGPDAGRFVDMIYTNKMSTLKVGRCRYGLMCSENGFLMDDGVVARLDEQTFLCHTTSGGADHIHAHMEDWLQTEWWDWQVYVANVTEQYAQIAVAGPKAREVLETVGGMDVAKDAMAFMDWADGALAGIPARVFRISFSGELSYEIAVPASRGEALWQALRSAGETHGIAPYGTEALHVLRAEKGLIMIGDETDGTVVPQDLGLDWAISKKKDDFIGMRGQQRRELSRPDRWKLVGLETLSGGVLPDGAYAVEEGRNANGQRNVQGRVTSTYRSPTLGRGIAMGLVRNGPDRTGEVLDFPGTDGVVHRARIVSPAFYDPEGERQNV